MHLVSVVLEIPSKRRRKKSYKIKGRSERRNLPMKLFFYAYALQYTNLDFKKACFSPCFLLCRYKSTT